MSKGKNVRRCGSKDTENQQEAHGQFEEGKMGQTQVLGGVGYLRKITQRQGFVLDDSMLVN